jgi:hypothetical protein
MQSVEEDRERRDFRMWLVGDPEVPVGALINREGNLLRADHH